MIFLWFIFHWNLFLMVQLTYMCHSVLMSYHIDVQIKWLPTCRRQHFKCIFLNENVCILIKISLKFVPKGPINNIPALVQIIVWCWPGDKPLSKPMMVRLPMHICVTQPQWVTTLRLRWNGCQLVADDVFKCILFNQPWWIKMSHWANILALPSKCQLVRQFTQHVFCYLNKSVVFGE